MTESPQYTTNPLLELFAAPSIRPADSATQDAPTAPAVRAPEPDLILDEAQWFLLIRLAARSYERFGTVELSTIPPEELREFIRTADLR